MDPKTLAMLVFTEKLADWLADQAIKEPRTLLTRKMVASQMPHRKLRETDFDDEMLGGTAYRTWRDPALQ